MDEYCHAFSAGKQVAFSFLCWSTAGFPYVFVYCTSHFASWSKICTRLPNL